LDFATIKKQLRGLAGFIGQCAIRATEAPLDQAVLHRLAAAEQTIGLEMAQRIRCAMFDGPPGGALRILSWYKWNDPRSENALVGATLPHQANSPSSNDTNVGRAAPSVVRRPTKRGSRKTVERD
jgi:hypothetical protein